MPKIYVTYLLLQDCCYPKKVGLQRCDPASLLVGSNPQLEDAVPKIHQAHPEVVCSEIAVAVSELPRQLSIKTRYTVVDRYQKSNKNEIIKVFFKWFYGWSIRLNTRAVDILRFFSDEITVSYFYYAINWVGGAVRWRFMIHSRGIQSSQFRERLLNTENIPFWLVAFPDSVTHCKLNCAIHTHTYIDCMNGM